MIEKYVNQTLGVGNCFAPSRKEWIASAIGAVGGIASSLFGGGAAASAARDARREREKAEAKENAWYNRRYNEDYVDTAAGQNLVRRAKEYAKENWKKAAGAQAVAGGTAAATQMAKDAGNKMVGETLANVAATDQARKAQVDNMHMQNEQKFAQQRQSEQLQRAQNITNAAQAASNAMMSIGSAVDQASVKTPSLTGGDNKGKDFNPPAVGSGSAEKTVEASNGETMSEQTAQDRIDKYNATLGG